MMKILIYLLLGLLLVGCTLTLSSREKELLILIQHNKDIKAKIEDYAFNETNIVFRFKNAEYPKTKSLETDRIIVTLVSEHQLLLYTRIRIDIKDKVAESDILNGDISPYLNFENNELKDLPTLSLLNVVYEQINKGLYLSILQLDEYISVKNSRPLLKADLSVGNLDNEAISDLLETYNKGELDDVNSELFDKLTELFNSVWITTKDKLVGGIVIKVESKLYISFEYDSEKIEEEKIVEMLNEWFITNKDKIPNDLKHIISIYKKGFSEVKRIDLVYRIFNGNLYHE